MRREQASAFSSLVVLLLFLTASNTALFAQKGSSMGGGHPAGGTPAVNLAPDPHHEDEFTVYDIPTTFTGEMPGTAQGPPPCFRWPISGTVSATISKDQLQVSDKAYGEFQDGCAAVAAKKLSKAQEDLQSAVKHFPRYAAAWVLLGQVQRDQKNEEEAAKSCQRAHEIDAKYLAPYLCLADISARAGKWDQVSALTSKVIDLHPLRAPGAYYYNALANFNLHQLEVAEKSGLEAVAEGRTEQKLQARLLLAKIYEQKGDRASEAVQLREYLKLKPPASDADVASRILQQIETQTAPAPSDKN